MSSNFENDYNHIRSGGSGYYEQKRGLIAVWGKEAVQFLDGLISNDVKTLEDGVQMLAAFPNAQGRLLAVVRVLRQGDRFLFETEDATREKVFNNLFRFTYAGDFFVEDLSEQYRYFELFGFGAEPSLTVRLLTQAEPPALAGGVTFTSKSTLGHFILIEDAANFRLDLVASGTVEISDDLHEVLRIESGIPKYGVDIDETTIVPELGIDGLISYKKGCYIGQEIIARIHFRGHVAKQLTGLVLNSPPARGGVAAASADGVVGAATGLLSGAELKTADGKNAGRITSTTFSPKLGTTIALAFVRFDYLAEGTKLFVCDQTATVIKIPFLN